MSLQIASINSGSNGNCYYIGNENTAVLVDAGISCRETEKRMNRLGLTMKKVKAIFISHEHGDHITGLPALSKKYQVPVYITEATHRSSRLPLEQDLVRSFADQQEIIIEDLKITCFSKFHDAADPYSFVIAENNIKVGVFTDIGIACENIVYYFKQCQAVFLEANYDEEMLEKGHYPHHLKNRIRNGNGHLSNAQALSLFKQHRPAFMSHLILSHLSKNNNDPQLVTDLFEPYADNVEIIIASRYHETDIYRVMEKAIPASNAKSSKLFLPGAQMSLF